MPIVKENIENKVPTSTVVCIAVGKTNNTIYKTRFCSVRGGFFYCPDFWLNTFGQGVQKQATEKHGTATQSQDKRVARASNHR